MKNRLITNVSSAQIENSPLRLHCYAILLEAQREDHCRIRGFLSDPAFEVFDLRLSCNCLEYEMKPEVSKMDEAMKQAGYVVLNGIHRLAFKDGTVLMISGGTDLDITDYDVMPNNQHYERIWQELPSKILKHWEAPYFLSVRQLPTETAKRLFSS